MLALALTLLLAGPSPVQTPVTCPHPAPKGGCAHKPVCLPLLQPGR